MVRRPYAAWCAERRVRHGCPAPQLRWDKLLLQGVNVRSPGEDITNCVEWIADRDKWYNAVDAFIDM